MADAGGFLDKGFEGGKVVVETAVVGYRKAGADDAAVDFGARGHADAALVQAGAFAARGGVDVVALGGVNQRFLQYAFVQQGDGNGVLRVAVQVVGGAVQRVDNPFVFGASAAAAAAFFGADAVVGVGFADQVDNQRFGLAVDVGDEIVGGFVIHAQAVEVVGGAQHQVAGFAGGFVGDVEGGVELAHGESFG